MTALLPILTIELRDALDDLLALQRRPAPADDMLDHKSTVAHLVDQNASGIGAITTFGARLVPGAH